MINLTWRPPGSEAMFRVPPERVYAPRTARVISPIRQWLVILLASVAVALLPAPLSVAAVVGVIALLFFLSNPLWGLYALLFAVPFESLRNIQAGSINVTVTEFVAFCIAAAWLARACATGRIERGPAPWLAALLIYGAVLGLSITQAHDFASSLKELLKWGELLAAYVVGVTLVRDRRDLRVLLVVLFAAAVSESLVGVAQALIHSGPSSFARGGFQRAAGTFDQPNPFAGYLNMCLPLAVAVLGYRVFPRKWVWPVVALCALGVLASLSRGGELASLTALLAMAALVSRGARIALGVAAVVVVALLAGLVVGVVPSSLTDPVATAFVGGNVDPVHPSPDTWAVAERLAHMEAGLAMWADQPLLGVGIGNYPARYPQYRIADVWQDPLGHAHNYYINIAAEAGVAGLTAFLILLVSALVICVRAYRRAGDDLGRALAVGATGVMAGIAMHSFFDNIFVHGMEVQMALVMVAVTRAGLFRPSAAVQER